MKRNLPKVLLLLLMIGIMVACIGVSADSDKQLSITVVEIDGEEAGEEAVVIDEYGVPLASGENNIDLTAIAAACVSLLAAVYIGILVKEKIEIGKISATIDKETAAIRGDIR